MICFSLGAARPTPPPTRGQSAATGRPPAAAYAAALDAEPDGLADAEPDADISPLRLRQSSTRTTSDASSPEP